MRPQTISITGVGTSAWVPVDRVQTPFNVSLSCVVNGTVTYDIQHTFDNVLEAGTSPTAFTHSTITGKTANTDGNYAFPVCAVRINISAGTGTVTLTILQGKGGS